MLVEVPQAKLAVHTEGEGRPVIFLNGFGSYKEIWTAQVATFSRHAQTVCFDYRGQGESTGAVATTLEQLADDLLAVIRSLVLIRPLLVGHSMGASVLWAFRQRHPEVPVSGLVIVDQSPKMLNTADWPFGYRNLTAATAPVQLTQPRQGHETLHGMVPEMLTAFIRAESQHPFTRDEGLPLLKSHFAADWRDVAIAETTPTLFVTAEQTPYFNNGYGEWLVQRNAHVREVLLADCGHDVMAEVPEAFNQTLRHFMKQHQ
ncbi:alpha/beta fold hydrolase [Lacticaseibacillus zhaodongensis]|uniref:alpha/beta fold hydrolase n=1 Tax=Lacticaseibacillus zhaodongensis TaxID=2668065 RepID=UPI0012D2A4FE|nr:alpha/beta hydrolase [Lacticaseibacillus zhaodongensis]